MTVLVQDDDFTLHQGDVLDILPTLETGSVDCVITSPPYWGLRDYGTGGWEGGDEGCDHVQRMARGDAGRVSTDDRPGNINPAPVDTPMHYRDVCGKCGARRQDRQLGLEPTPDEYVTRMVAVFRQVRRVLAPYGTCWVNIGDSYASSVMGVNNNGQGASTIGYRADGSYSLGPDGSPYLNELSRRQRQGIRVEHGLKPKDLVGIPWRLAFALQQDGWYLRADIIWAKPNPMPESVTDRPTKAHEYVFLLTKQPRYWFDQEAVREPSLWSHDARADLGHIDYDGKRQGDPGTGQRAFVSISSAGRNIRSVWEIATQPYPEAHFATYPEELVRRCLLAGCPEWVCRTCGKPRERIVETERWRTRDVDGHTTVGEYERSGHPSRGPSDDIPRKGNFAVASQTLGFSDCGHGEIDDRIEAWHEGDDSRPLHEYLGWTWEEYRTWVEMRVEPHNYRPGIVLDPFIGSGTTALVARKHGRHTIGIELSPGYAHLAARRTQQLSLEAALA